MTYPQQPVQPPYGQPGQQPGPHSQGGYPQQYGQYPAPPGYGAPGPYGQPPKKKTGLWIGISAGVVAVAAFLVTGLLAPGFLLGDDSDSGSSGTAEGGNEVDGGRVDAGDSEAAALAEQIVQGFADRDQEALDKLICAGSKPEVGGYTSEAVFVEVFELTGPVQESGDTANATAHVVLEAEGQRHEGKLGMELANEAGGWCWKHATEM